MEPAIDFTEKLGGWLQVDLGRTDVHVPHVRSQGWKAGIDIFSVAIPGQEPMDRERVAKIMNARSGAAAPRDAALLQQVHERLTDRWMT